MRKDGSHLLFFTCAFISALFFFFFYVDDARVLALFSSFFSFFFSFLVFVCPFHFRIFIKVATPETMGSLKDIICEDSLVRASHVEHLQENLWEVELFAFSAFPKVSCRLSCVENVLPVIPPKVLSSLLSIMNEQSQALILRVDYCTYGVIHGTETLTSLFGDILFLTHPALYCSSVSSSATIAKGARRWISLQEMCIRLLIGYPARPTIFRWKSLYNLARTAADALFPPNKKTPNCFHVKARCVVLDVIRADTFVVQWEDTRRTPTKPPPSLSSSPETSNDAILPEPYPPVLVLRMTPSDGQNLESMTVPERLALWWARRYIGETLDVDIHTVSPSELDLSCNVYARQLDRRGVVEGLARGEDGRDISTLLLSHRLATLRDIAFPFYPLYLDVFCAVTQLVLHPLSERETTESEHQKRIPEERKTEETEEGVAHARQLLPRLISPVVLLEGGASTAVDTARSDTGGADGEWCGEEQMKVVVTQIRSRTQLKPRALSLLLQFLEPEWWYSRCARDTTTSLTRRLFHQYLYCGNYKAVDKPKLMCLYYPLRMVFPMHKLPQLKIPLRGSIKQVLFHLDPPLSSSRPTEKGEHGKASDGSLPLVTTSPMSLYVQLDIEVLEHQVVWEHYMEKLCIVDPQRLFIWTPDPFDTTFFQEVRVSVQYTGVVQHATLFVHAKEYIFDDSFRVEDHVVSDNAYTKVVPTVEFNGSFLEYSFGKFTVKDNEEKIIIFDVFIEHDTGKETNENVEGGEGEKGKETKKEEVRKQYLHRVLYHLSPQKPQLVEDEQMGVECDADVVAKDGGAHHDAEEEDVDDDVLQDGAQGTKSEGKSVGDISFTEAGLTMYVSTMPFFFRLEFPSNATRESIFHGDVFAHLRRWSATTVVCLPVAITRVHGILGFVGNVYFLPMDGPPSISGMLGDLQAFSFRASFQKVVTLLERASQDMYDALHACWGETAAKWEGMDDMQEVRDIARDVRHTLLQEKQEVSPFPTPPSLRFLGRRREEGTPPIPCGQEPSFPASSSRTLSDGIANAKPTAVLVPKEEEAVARPMQDGREAAQGSGPSMPSALWEWVDAASPDYCPPTMAPYILPRTLPLISFSVTSRQLVGENHKKSKTVFSPAKDHPFPFVGHMDYYFWTRVRFPVLPNIFSGHLDQLPLACRNIERRYCAYLIRAPLSPDATDTCKGETPRDEEEVPGDTRTEEVLASEATQDRKIPIGCRGDHHFYAGEAAFARFMTIFFHLRAFTVRYRQAVNPVLVRTEYDVLTGIPEALFHADDLSSHCISSMVLYRVPLLSQDSFPSSPLSWRLFLGAKDGTFSDVLELPASHNVAKDLMFFSKRWMRRVISSVAFDSFVSPSPLATVPLPLPPPSAKPRLPSDAVQKEGIPKTEEKDRASKESRRTTGSMDSIPPTNSSPLPRQVHLREMEGFGRAGEGSGEEKKEEVQVLLATTAGSRQVSGVREFGYDRRVASRPVVYHPLSWLHVLGKPLMRREEVRDGVDVEGTPYVGKGVTRPHAVDNDAQDDDGKANLAPSSALSPSRSVDSGDPARPREAMDGGEREEKVLVTHHILLFYRLIGLTVRKPYRPFSFSRFSKKFIHLELKKSWKELQFIQNWCSLLLHRSTPYSVPFSLPSPSAATPMAVPREMGHGTSPSSSSLLGTTSNATPRAIDVPSLDGAASSSSSIAATGMLVLFGSTCCAINAYFATKRQLRRGELIPETARSLSLVMTEEEEEQQEQYDLEDLANPIRALLQEIDDACGDIPCSRFFLTVESSQPVELRPPAMLVTVHPVEESNDGSTSLNSVTWGSEKEERAVYAPAVREDEEKSGEAALFPDRIQQAEESGDLEEGGKQVENSHNAFAFAAKNPHRPFHVLDEMYEKRIWKVEYDFFHKRFCWEQL